jgi:predicted ATP-dependent serine protease
MTEDIKAAVDSAIADIKPKQETKEVLSNAAKEYRDERQKRERIRGNGKANDHDKTADNVTGFNWRVHVFTAAELQRRTFPPVSYCVPDLIPEGLTIIAGKPKIGKSWLALDVCIAIAAGRICLGERKPTQGDVLYAAMEDNPRRLQRRIDRLLSPVSTEWPQRLTLANAWRRLDKGGVDDVRQWMEHAENPRLVILDTLAGVTMLAAVGLHARPRRRQTRGVGLKSLVQNVRPPWSEFAKWTF